MSATVELSLAGTVVRFCRALREHGFVVTPAESVDAARALGNVDLGDREELYLALRTLLATRPEEYVAFDELFDRYWAPPRTGARAGDDRRSRSPAVPRPLVEQARETSVATLTRWMRATGRENDDATAIPRASDREGLGARDFRSFGDEELREITRVAARMARRLATRPSRRWRPAAHGTRVHLRRTIRRALATGGTAAELAFRERKPRKTRLVVLCDVSGSMELYSRFLLQFVYALQHAFARVESFVFATRPSRITNAFGAPRYRGALDLIARDVRDWSGGTRIGASLAAFEQEWGRWVDRRTVVIILSDGWDTGDPEQLGDALARIRRRAGRIIWLNPLLGSPDYQPLARGMQAALPYVDVFHAAHNLASLEALARHLTL